MGSHTVCRGDGVRAFSGVGSLRRPSDEPNTRLVFDGETAWRLLALRSILPDEPLTAPLTAEAQGGEAPPPVPRLPTTRTSEGEAALLRSSRAQGFRVFGCGNLG